MSSFVPGRAALLLLLPLIGGCVTVNSTVLMDRSSMPVAPLDVYVYLAGDVVPESCQRVAILHAEGSQDSTNPSQMLDKMREEAGKLGANAVHVRSMEDAGTSERIASWILDDVEAQRTGEALALWCPDGSGR